jgi:hypothetical protein
MNAMLLKIVVPVDEDNSLAEWSRRRTVEIKYDCQKTETSDFKKKRIMSC